LADSVNSSTLHLVF